MGAKCDLLATGHPSGFRIRSRVDTAQLLEHIAFALESAAFRLLEHENRAYLAGQHHEVAALAKWRSNIRVVADAFCARCDR